MPLLRHPAFAVGLVLLVLGVGNWSVAHSKLAEYLGVPSGGEAAAGNFEGFPELDARTNAGLLRPFQRGMDAHAVADQKRDFYTVVQTGGQLLAFAGAGMILFALGGAWRRGRGPLVLARPD